MTSLETTQPSRAERVAINGGQSEALERGGGTGSGAEVLRCHQERKCLDTGRAVVLADLHHNTCRPTSVTSQCQRDFFSSSAGLAAGGVCELAAAAAVLARQLQATVQARPGREGGGGVEQTEGRRCC